MLQVSPLSGFAEDLKSCVSMLKHVTHPLPSSGHPAAQAPCVDAGQFHLMDPDAQSSCWHSHHPQNMPCFKRLQGPDSMSTLDATAHAIDSAVVPAPALPPMSSTSLMPNIPFPFGNPFGHGANVPQHILGSQQQYSANSMHSPAQHTSQPAASQTGIYAVSQSHAFFAHTTPLLVEPLAASPGVSALLTAPTPSAMLLSPAPAVQPLAAIAQLSIGLVPAASTDDKLPSAFALPAAYLPSATAVSSATLCKTAALLVSEPPAAHQLQFENRHAALAPPHHQLQSDAAQPHCVFSTACLPVKDQNLAVAAPITAETEALARASTGEGLAALMPPTSTAADAPSPAAPLPQSSKAGRSHKRKPDNSKQTGAPVAQRPAQRRKPNQQDSPFAGDSGGLEPQTSAADKAQLVRRSSRDRKMSRIAIEAAEDPRHQQPCSRSKRQAPQVRPWTAQPGLRRQGR